MSLLSIRKNKTGQIRCLVKCTAHALLLEVASIIIPIINRSIVVISLPLHIVRLDLCWLVLHDQQVFD